MRAVVVAFLASATITALVPAGQADARRGDVYTYEFYSSDPVMRVNWINGRNGERESGSLPWSPRRKAYYGYVSSRSVVAHQRVKGAIVSNGFFGYVWCRVYRNGRLIRFGGSKLFAVVASAKC